MRETTVSMMGVKVLVVTGKLQMLGVLSVRIVSQTEKM
jgi:hypothetical protein